MTKQQLDRQWEYNRIELNNRKGKHRDLYTRRAAEIMNRKPYTGTAVDKAEPQDHEYDW